jgi:hypothetical protein
MKPAPPAAATATLKIISRDAAIFGPPPEIHCPSGQCSANRQLKVNAILIIVINLRFMHMAWSSIGDPKAAFA